MDDIRECLSAEFDTAVESMEPVIAFGCQLWAAVRAYMLWFARHDLPVRFLATIAHMIAVMLCVFASFLAVARTYELPDGLVGTFAALLCMSCSVASVAAMEFMDRNKIST